MLASTCMAPPASVVGDYQPPPPAHTGMDVPRVAVAGDCLQGRIDAVHAEVLLVGRESTTTLQTDGKRVWHKAEQHEILRLSTQSDANGQFSFHLPRHLPTSLRILAHRGADCHIDYRLLIAGLGRASVILRQPLPRPVDAVLTLTMGDALPLTRSYCCGLWNESFTSWHIESSSNALVLQPGQGLSVQWELPPSPWRLVLRLSEHIFWTARGAPFESRHVHYLKLQNGAVMIPRHLRPTLASRCIRIRHQLIASLVDPKGRLRGSSSPMAVDVVVGDDYQPQIVMAPFSARTSNLTYQVVMAL